VKAAVLFAKEQGTPDNNESISSRQAGSKQQSSK